MDTKHNDDILKTRGKNKKGEYGQPPATPQPKKQRFIDLLAESIEKAFKDLNKYLEELAGYDKISNFCIGSGSHFIVYKDITYRQAKELYENYKNKLPLGSKINEQIIGFYRFESYHTMESSSGITTCFLFEITEVISTK